MLTNISSKSLSELDHDQSLEVDNRNTHSFQVATNLLVSFKYAWAGLVYAFTTQRNFRVHTILGLVVLSLSKYLSLPPVDFAVIGLTISAVLVMELLNTALESVVDLAVGQNFHPLAKIAKDCAAGAVLVSAIASVLVASSLLLPKLLVMLTN